MDHFERDKKTYGGAPKQPNSSSNVDELAKNAAKLSDTCWINAATSTLVDVPTFDTTKAADFNGATTFDGFRHHCPVAHDVPTSSTSTFDGFQHHCPVAPDVPTNGATTFDGFRHHCPVAHDVPTSSTSTFADLRHHWPVPHEVPSITAAKKTSATTTAANKKQNMWSKPEKSDGCVNVDKSEENTEEINILSIQTKESTSKSATITPKIVGNKPKPAKQASKAKVEKLGWDTPLPAELAKEF